MARKPKRKKSQRAMDEEAKDFMARAIKNFVDQKTFCQSGGNNADGVQQVLDGLSGIIGLYGDPVEKGLGRALTRVTGLSRNVFGRGKKLVDAGLACPRELSSAEKSKDGKGRFCKLARRPHSSGKRKKRNMNFVYDYFHESCPLVEPDKSRPTKGFLGKNLKIVVSGETKKVTCTPRVRYGSKKDLVQCFKEGKEYAAWQKQNPGDKLPDSAVRRCICPCIHASTVTECACKICTEFTKVLQALRKQVTHTPTHTHLQCIYTHPHPCAGNAYSNRIRRMRVPWVQRPCQTRGAAVGFEQPI
jgi:hypothetical protein